jgi:hypothetical protein
VVRMLGSAPHATRRPFVSSRGLGLVLRCLCHSLFLRCGAALVEFFGHLRTGTVEVRGRIPSSADEFVDGTSCNGFQVAGRSSEWEDDLVDDLRVTVGRWGPYLAAYPPCRQQNPAGHYYSLVARWRGDRRGEKGRYYIAKRGDLPTSEVHQNVKKEPQLHRSLLRDVIPRSNPRVEILGPFYPRLWKPVNDERRHRRSSSQRAPALARLIPRLAAHGLGCSMS